MAGYLVPPTKNPGDVLTSALWNTYVRDNLDFGMVRPIADTILGVAAASIDLTSIPQTFAHLRLECYLRGDTAALTTFALLRFNNISSTSYQWQKLVGNAAVTSAVEGLAQTAINVGDIPANTAGASMFGASVIEIPNYANAVGYKNAEVVTGTRFGVATGNGYSIRASSWFDSTAAINRITLFPTAGNFVAGTRVTLYGMGGI